jgi:peptide-methionine (S)-S-oxide reductase
MKIEVATFGAGCFLCIEAVIQRLKGIETIASGYSGGLVPGPPTYSAVCSGKTGYAEVVQVKFNAEEISYHDLITIFMTSHDPTQLNQQGADRGTQYRSVIYYHSIAQKEIAAKVFSEIKAYYYEPIVTELSEAQTFYVADKEHQEYYNQNAGNGYCRIVIDPKISKLRTMYADKLKQ